MSIFIPVDIVEYVVELVAQKCLWSAHPGGTDSEALQWWLLKFGGHSKKLRISVEYFVDWLANTIPSWVAYQEFMTGCLIALDKLPSVHPVGAWEIWRQLFAK